MILIRCNAGIRVGMGHLVRCRVLADVFRDRGHECVLVGPPDALQQSSDAKLFKDWIARPEWISDSVEALFHMEMAKKIGTTHIMVDDYRSDFEHQLALRQSGLRVAQQYDASRARRFAAHVVINSSPAEKRADYEAGLFRPDIQMLHGPAYAVLRRSFLDVVMPEPRAALKRILVTFGGGDDLGGVRFVLESLQEWGVPDVTLVIVLGKHNPNIEFVKSYIEKQSGSLQYELHVDATNMPEIMGSCDLAIMGGGTGTFEAAYCGLPMVLIAIAENQYKQCQGWENLQVSCFLGPLGDVNKRQLLKAVESFYQQPSKRIDMSRRIRNHVDGRGVDRIVDALLEQQE